MKYAGSIMGEAEAFCPAHITGFFKACDCSAVRNYHDIQDAKAHTGSMGAGFSLCIGVTTSVRIIKGRQDAAPYTITVSGYGGNSNSDGCGTNVSRAIVKKFLELAGSPDDITMDIKHDIAVPVGYGLGSSGAVALSLAYALDSALRTNLGREKSGTIAHNAEIECRTGLGDVLASFHGGFEIRTSPGAPGVGSVQKICLNKITIIMICLAPISTNKFISKHLSRINGLGGVMVDRLLKTKDYMHFQRMSLEFAEYANVITPNMKAIIDELDDMGAQCGVALFGETLFCMMPAGSSMESDIMRVMRRHPEGITIKAGLDEAGARMCTARQAGV